MAARRKKGPDSLAPPETVRGARASSKPRRVDIVAGMVQVEVEGEQAAAVWLDPRSLKPLDRNPKKRETFDKAVATVKQLIKRFGWGPTVVVQRSSGMVVAGNARRQAAIELNLPAVPARVLDLSDRDARAMALADSRAGQIAQWEKSLLAADLGALRDDGEDLFDLGFEKQELDRLLGEHYHSEVAEVDVTEGQATFFLSATGPLPAQLDVLDRLREAFAGTDVEVVITTTEL